MFLILSLIILVAAFNIISSLIMLVKNKQIDIAILRTMGASQNTIMKIFFLNGRVAPVVKICFFVISFIIIINPFHSSRIIYVNEEFSLDGYFPKNTCLSNEV